jgi:protoheme IX farnesyltransferase
MHDTTRDLSRTPGPRSVDRFVKYTWLLLIYNLMAVAWGVYVRSSKSGDGCGSHWPLCNGDHTPLMGDLARTVELSHRVSTALIGPMVIALVIWAMRLFPKGHLVRKASWSAFGFTMLEGAIGAALVIFGLVTTNDSATRAGVMSFHVVSTFMLVGSIGVAMLAATMKEPPTLRGQGSVGTVLGMGALGIVFLGISGSISALGHQLHRTPDVLAAAMNPATHWMVRLQPLHPLIAVSVGLYLLLTAGLITHLRPDPRVRLAVKWMLGLYGLQMLIGLLNIVLKAPIALQSTHLVLADLNWLSLVAVGLYAFAPDVERVEHRPAPVDVSIPDRLVGRDLVNAYVALTKPRVISLLLFTCLTAAVAAKGGWPGFWLFTTLAIAGYGMAGAANAINMVVDRDLDRLMKRTSRRPTVTQAIPSTHVLRFAMALAVGSFAALWSVANLLSAVLAFSGLVFYVVVYTLLLKRRTWHNIVIGGAAGAFPPLVGWAAVTGDLPPLSLYLFAIIFVWTPVHFWALALMLKDDYEAAGVPMLPVVRGVKTTVTQILAYAVVTCVVTLLPWTLPQVGYTYLLGAAVLNLMLLAMCIRLYRHAERPEASRVFHFSMLYLALLFLVFAVDRTIVLG